MENLKKFYCRGPLVRYSQVIFYFSDVQKMSASYGLTSSIGSNKLTRGYELINPSKIIER